MKQVAMGRKAWLFVCSVAGGEQSAKMMTLVSSARRHDLDVRVYIKDVLDQLLAGSTDYHSLLPDVWKQTHPEAVRDYRVEERRDKAERKQLRAARRRLAARARASIALARLQRLAHHGAGGAYPSPPCRPTTGLARHGWPRPPAGSSRPGATVSSSRPRWCKRRSNCAGLGG